MDRDDDKGAFALMVTVPAEDWAFQRRRLSYLEAVLVQVLCDRGRLREWFSASDLAAMRLPGLPGTRQGMLRLANAEGWRRRAVTRQGGETNEFHCASLPGRAFDALVDRIVSAAMDDAPPQLRDDTPPVAHVASASASAAPPVNPPIPDNTTPPWVLPLLRVIRQNPAATLEQAVAAVPRRYGVPPVDDVRHTLDTLKVQITARSC